MNTPSNGIETYCSIQPHNAIWVYANLPDEERADPAIAKRAVSFDGLAIMYTPLKARTHEVVQAAIRNTLLAHLYIEHNIVRPRPTHLHVVPRVSDDRQLVA